MNRYDHPHTEVLEEIVERDIDLFRTDKQGTIIFTSDGNNINVVTQGRVSQGRGN